MATTFIDYTGDGNATKSFSFPSIKESDVKVEVDTDLKTSGTHYNITSYTTTGGGNVVFIDNSGSGGTNHIPQSPSAIRIFRDTDVDSAKATYTAGSSVKADDLNNNHEQLLFAAQEEQNQTVITSRIKDGAVTTGKIEADAITSALIADDQINSEHIAAGAVDLEHMSANSVDSDQYVDGSIDLIHMSANSVDSDQYVDGSIDLIHMSANSVDSNQYVDGSIDRVHLEADIIDSTKLADNAVGTEHIQADAVTMAKLGSGALPTDVTVASANIVDLTIATGDIANDAITVNKIADSELKTLAGMQSGTASVLADSTALTASTAELNQLDGITLETSLTSSDTRIPTSKAVNDQILAVTNAVGGFVAVANETSFPATNPDPSNGAGTVVSISQVSSASAVTVNGSGVATITNGAGTGNTVTITGFPATLQNTSLAANSGLQVQTTTTLHTYTFHKQLASAADIAAISATVNSFSNRYRVSASAPTSSLDGGDLWYDTTNSKLMVYSSQNSAWEESSAIGNFFISTISSSSNTGGGSATANGTAYRFTISDAPVSAQQLIVSVDGVIQKPNAGSSQPSEGFVLVSNDIIFGSAPANGASMFVTVIGSTVGIGTPSNNTVTSAILQNGSVINSKLGADAVDGTKIADDSINSEHYVDGSIDTAHIANDAVNADKLANSINSEIAANTAKTTNATHSGEVTGATALTIADNVVDEANLKVSNSPTNGYFLSAQSGNTGGLTWAQVSTDVVADTSPQLGADLDVNDFNIKNGTSLIDITDGGRIEIDIAGTEVVDINGGGVDIGTGDVTFPDSSKAKFGASSDLQIYHDGNDSYLNNSGEGNLIIRGDDVHIQGANGDNMANFIEDGAVQLRHDGDIKFETTSSGTSFNNGTAVFNGPSGTSYTAEIKPTNGNPYGLGVIENSGANAGYPLFAVTDNGGQTYFRTLSGGISEARDLRPVANNTYDLGTSSVRWRNIYTNDLNLSNEGSSNDVDGSWGDWTIQEGESDLFLKNNRSGKKYKFNLTEVA